MSAATAQAPNRAVPTHVIRRAATIWIAYGVMGILVAGYLSFKIVYGGRPWPFVDGWMVAGFELIASGLCVVRGLVRRSGRAAALVLGVGLLCWSVGDVALTVESLGGATPPTPSLADAFYLGFFPLAYVAVVLMMRAGARQLATSSWLDGAVAGLGAAAVCAAFAFPGLRHLVGGNSLAVATNLAYPVGDLLLLFLAVGCAAMLSGRRKMPYVLVAIAVAVNIAGDTSNLLGASIGATRFGTIANAVAWPTSILLMSIAVWLPRGLTNRFVPQKPAGFVLPGVAALSGLAILAFGTVHRTGHVAIGLAIATLVVVGIRLTLSARSLRALTEKRFRQSVTDELTGLGNRRHLFHVLNAFFAGAADTSTADRSLAFLFVDLDKFKELNDSFGHPAGDEILIQLSARLTASLRGSDELIRFGGDEFAVVLLDADAGYATTVAQHLTASLQKPFLLEGVNPRISASIGIAHAPADATDIAGLISCADVAMYRAKSGAVPFVVFAHDHDLDGGGNHLRLAEELRVAIDDGQLVLHYQPQLDLRSAEISTVEALLRWPHPRLGLVPPLKFLPVAEEAGLMGALTRWVLNQALAQCAAWREAGHSISVSVNVSATNLLDAGFIDLIRNLLELHELPAEAVVIEITETSIIRDVEQATLVIQGLEDLGVVASIDDFGAGFTSLAHLSSLAVGELKLDRTFITRLATGHREREIPLVRATIDLAHALGLRVVAEGVEDYGTLALLARCGCDLAQGYFIDMPRPAHELAFLQPENRRKQPSATGTVVTPIRQRFSPRGHLVRDTVAHAAEH